MSDPKHWTHAEIDAVLQDAMEASDEITKLRERCRLLEAECRAIRKRRAVIDRYKLTDGSDKDVERRLLNEITEAVAAHSKAMAATDKAGALRGEAQ